MTPCNVSCTIQASIRLATPCEAFSFCSKISVQGYTDSICLHWSVTTSLCKAPGQKVGTVSPEIPVIIS